MVEAESLGIIWRLPPASDRIAVLLGAFDPPTNAHVEILGSTARNHERAPVWGMTKVLLDRPGKGLFTVDERAELVSAVAHRTEAGFAIFDAGTYLDVHRALCAAGVDALFVIGSDKLERLREPAFYPDGTLGVSATFDEVDFVVIDRDPSSLSATKVRRAWADGEFVADLVPSEVSTALRLKGRGYTSGR